MDIKIRIKEGEELFNDGQIDKAEAIFQELFKLQPDNTEILNNLGVIANACSLPEDAERYFLRAIALDEKHNEPIKNLGLLYINEYRWEEASAYLEKAISQGEACSDLFDTLAFAKAQSKCNGSESASQPATKANSSVNLIKGAGQIQSGAANKLSLTRSSLVNILKKTCYYPHPDIRRGSLHLDKKAFQSHDRDCNVLISPGARLDLTGDLTIGAWSMIGEGTVILTHDHFHEGRKTPLLKLQENKGIKWANKVIGRDVWLHGSTVLLQVTEIPDGVVVGAGAVLTRNPGAYEIWAGNPAQKVGER